MQKIFKKFYFLTKLSSSLILLLLVIFLIYLFSKAYIEEANLVTNTPAEEFNEIRYEVSDQLKKNNDLILDVANRIKKIENEIDLLKLKNNDENNRTILEDISKISKEILILKNNNKNKNVFSKNEKLFDEKKFLIVKYIDNIILSIDEGYNYNDAIQELVLLIKDENLKTYLDRLLIISYEENLSFEKLKENFELNSNLFLKKYLLYKSDNSYITKFILKFFNLKINKDKKNEDSVIENLSNAKNYLYEKDISNSIKELIKIDDIESHFGLWIESAQKIEESKKLILSLKSEMENL